jgi:hypothetical protein
MNDESTLLTLIFVGMAIGIHLIFLFKREILFNKMKFRVLLSISFGLFLLGYLLKGLDISSKNMAMMQVPFLALIIFYIMSFIYNKMFGENPADSFWSMDISLMKDGIFNFLFWVVGLIAPILLAYKIL